ncbi:MAG: protein kinase [Vicinamibacteria bacterium]|nr:protein kinase [Vicinamibacteria bacterium]
MSETPRPLPRALGKYELRAVLGSGAMGTVYAAHDASLDRTVALKLLSPALLGRADAIARFEREARAAARLTHPGIVTVYELGHGDEGPFIAMELLDGVDLAQAIAERRLAPGLRLRLMVDVCRALDFAHKRGVIHRDVKPANIRLTADGSVKLVDFGIARLRDSHLTQTGIVLGTPQYMSPEVLRGAAVDLRADMWAAGVVLHELLVGRCPFEADSVAALAYKIVHEPFVPPPLSALEAPREVADVIERALRKAPEQRFLDMAEMASALALAARLSAPVEPALAPADRAAQARQALDDARRKVATGTLDGALAAARRAQALDPGLAEAVDLVARIEELMDEAPTVRVAAAPAPAPAPPAPVPAQAPAVAAARPRQASALREATVFGDAPGSHGALLAPDGERLVLAGADGALRVWSLGRRERLQTLSTKMHRRTSREAIAVALAISADGRWLASGHVDGAVRLWDLEAGAELACRLRHDASVPALAFSPDGATLASGGLDATLKLWDLEGARAGDARRELLRQPAPVTAIAWVGDELVTGHANRVLRVLDGGSRRLLATLRGPEGAIAHIAADQRAHWIAVASQDRDVTVFDLERRAPVARLGLPRRPACGLALADGLLAIATLEHGVPLWDLRAAPPSSTTAWAGAGESCVAVALPPRGLAAVLQDGRVRLFTA